MAYCEYHCTRMICRQMTETMLARIWMVVDSVESQAVLGKATECGYYP